VATQKQHIRFDWAMKRLLRQKANFEVLEGFLSELLKEDVSIQSIEEGESNQTNGQVYWPVYSEQSNRSATSK
jgi:hypothetical protein